tara:strand:- start:699 stop:1463 length:765 start_codon:yes stop_codon:yes gene_type:complete
MKHAKKRWKGHIVPQQFKCNNCGKKYRFRSGLSRHRKNCKSKEDEEIETKESKVLNNDIVVKLLEQQQETQRQILELCKNHKVINYNNCTNQKMTINFFLNEKCGNAMNINEFIENVKVSLEDLEYTNQHGYAKGISNIFEKHLIEMKPTERPIHCSDKKRLQFYVRDENKWMKDKNNEKINKTINTITMKQIKKLKDWEKENPTYLEDSDLMLEWHYRVRAIMGGSDDKMVDKNKGMIQKALGNMIEIKGAME